MNNDVAFFKMPKTGGSSVDLALDNRCVILPHGPDDKTDVVRKYRESHRHAFVFCFLRNPFDRLLSAYSYHVGDSRYKHAVDFEDRKKYIEPYRDFRDFVVHGVGSGLVVEQRHVKPQHSWITDDGKLLVDWMGHTEALQEDFDEVCRLIGIDTRRLGVENQSNHQDYRCVYDEEMADIVARTFAMDFELGGYSTSLLR